MTSTYCIVYQALGGWLSEAHHQGVYVFEGVTPPHEGGLIDWVLGHQGSLTDAAVLMLNARGVGNADSAQAYEAHIWSRAEALDVSGPELTETLCQVMSGVEARALSERYEAHREAKTTQPTPSPAFMPSAAVA